MVYDYSNGCGMMGAYGGYGWIFGLLIFLLMTILVAVIFWFTYKAIILDSGKRESRKEHHRKR